MFDFLNRNAKNRCKAATLLLVGGAISYAAGKLRRALIHEERRLSEKKLRRSEERLRLALDGGRMGMWEWTVGTLNSRWNDRKYQLLGFPVGDGKVSSELFFKNIHPEDAPGFNLALQETLESGCDFHQEFRFIRPDGETRWLVEKARVYPDSEGKPSRMIGVTYDITDHKLTEEELQASMNELSVLMDTVPAVILIAHDPGCGLISCGMKARQLLRLPEGQREFIPSPEQERIKLFRLLRNGRDLTPEELPLRIAATGREVRNFELTVLFNDGASIDLMGDAVPLFDNSGRVRGAVGAFVDITVLKNTQIELEKARTDLGNRVEDRTEELRRTLAALQSEMEKRARTVEELREKDQLLVQQSRLAAMGEMINNIAHQWRQPLNSIALIVQELPVMYRKGEFSSEYLNEMVNKAKGHIFDMSKTVEDFKTFFEPNRERVAFKVADAVAKSLDLVRDGLEALHIKVEVNDAGDPVIFGYSNEFSQVLINILLNCRDAFLEQKKGKPRTIKIRIFTQGDKTVITIADNAGGIPENVIEKIFDPYFTTKGPGKGTGIGLFMGKTIIERHMHGRLTVHNTEDGVEFRIELVSEVPAG
jgi:PAS domain S-box-containing protein